MFVPLRDYMPLRRIKAPIVTYGLIALTVGVWLLAGAFASPQKVEANVLGFGMIPALLWGQATLADGLAQVPPAATLLTSLFMHANLLHLAGNMLFLWVFGDNVEDAFGHIRFLGFYLVCGMAAALMHAFIMPQSQQPLIGASGAVAGVLAAYLILHPRVYVWGLVLKWFPMRLRAIYALGVWMVFQVVMALTASPGSEVGWWAHVGGMIAGAALTPLMRQPGVVLFDRSLEHGA
ncbi:MAG: rhomboid family intramembrane serine protease [Beijerinckiaceae bacterium]